ncbi:MAG: hypothetical protein ABI112_13940 [Terracoccus sp.]
MSPKSRGAGVLSARVTAVPTTVDDLAVEADLGLAHRHPERAAQVRQAHLRPGSEEVTYQRALDRSERLVGIGLGAVHHPVAVGTPVTPGSLAHRTGGRLDRRLRVRRAGGPVGGKLRDGEPTAYGEVDDGGTDVVGVGDPVDHRASEARRDTARRSEGHGDGAVPLI